MTILGDALREQQAVDDLARQADQAVQGPIQPQAVAGPVQSELAAWPEPQPLVASMKPEPHPVDPLPDTIQAAVREIQAFVKAPMPLVGSSALAALSLAIQPYVDIKRAEKLAGPCSLFLLTIADSGERKSTCDAFFTQAIRDYETQQTDLAQPELQDHQAQLMAWEAKRNGIRDKIRSLAKAEKPLGEREDELQDLERHQPQPPRIPRLLYTDATPEALAHNLSNRWPSGGVLSAEAGLVLGSHGMNRDSILRNLGLLNTFWDGGQLNIDRRTKDSFAVRGARLTMGLQVQEATLREFFERSGDLARGTGFLARFLIAWPTSTQGFRPFTEAPPDWPSLTASNRRIADILSVSAPCDDHGGLNPVQLTFSPHAKDAWVGFHDAIEAKLRNGGELFDVRDVASKTADNAARLAALFSVFQHGPGEPVGLDVFEGASRLAAWHLSESRRFFGELALPQELLDAARLDRWLLNHCRSRKTYVVPRRVIQRFVTPVRLRDKRPLNHALADLEDSDRAYVSRVGKKIDVQVNPKLLVGSGT